MFECVCNCVRRHACVVAQRYLQSKESETEPLEDKSSHNRERSKTKKRESVCVCVRERERERPHF